MPVIVQLGPLRLAYPNAGPVWVQTPTPTFITGVASVFPATGTYQSNGYVTDPEGNPITIASNAVPVPGVSWDGGRFVYDGTGAVQTIPGHVLIAEDGQGNSTPSASFSITISPSVNWASVPAPSFVESTTTPYNLGQNVTGYSAATDTFQVTPTYSLPPWLSLTGTGSGNLTPNGTQVDANDIPANPGIKIDVRRSGGAWVSSSAFGVTVTAAPSVNDVWTRLDSGGGPTSGQGWTWSCINNTTRKIFIGLQGNRIYDLATNQWSTISGSLTPGLVEENAGFCWDETNNIIVRGPGGPGTLNGAFPSQETTFNVSTGIYSAVPGSGAANIDTMYAWNAGTFYRVGGFSINVMTDLHTKTSADGAWVAKNPAGTAPTFLGEASGGSGSRVTYTRGGVDSRTGQVWVMATEQELYVWEPIGNRWSHLPTTGSKPPYSNTVFAMHEAKDCIVGFCGNDRTVNGGGGTDLLVRQTYILDLATLNWRLGPSGAAAAPAATSLVLYFGMYYDRIGKRVVLMSADAITGAQVWSLEIEETQL